MQLLCRALRQEIYVRLLFAAAALVGGGLLIGLNFPEQSVASVCGLILLLGGLYFGYVLLPQTRADNSHLLHLLNTNPEKIVWVYGLRTQRHPFGLSFSQSGILYFKLADGDEISVGLPATKLKLVSAFLNRVLPHAVFGYTKERAENYQNNPAGSLG